MSYRDEFANKYSNIDHLNTQLFKSLESESKSMTNTLINRGEEGRQTVLETINEQGFDDNDF